VTVSSRYQSAGIARQPNNVLEFFRDGSLFGDIDQADEAKSVRSYAASPCDGRRLTRALRILCTPPQTKETFEVNNAYTNTGGYGAATAYANGILLPSGKEPNQKIKGSKGLNPVKTTTVSKKMAGKSPKRISKAPKDKKKSNSFTISFKPMKTKKPTATTPTK
jgi:hypothetical protein